MLVLFIVPSCEEKYNTVCNDGDIKPIQEGFQHRSSGVLVQLLLGELKTKDIIIGKCLVLEFNALLVIVGQRVILMSLLGQQWSDAYTHFHTQVTHVVPRYCCSRIVNVNNYEFVVKGYSVANNSVKCQVSSTHNAQKNEAQGERKQRFDQKQTKKWNGM